MGKKPRMDDALPCGGGDDCCGGSCLVVPAGLQVLLATVIEGMLPGVTKRVSNTGTPKVKSP